MMRIRSPTLKSVRASDPVPREPPMPPRQAFRLVFYRSLSAQDSATLATCTHALVTFRRVFSARREPPKLKFPARVSWWVRGCVCVCFGFVPPHRPSTKESHSSLEMANAPPVCTQTKSDGVNNGNCGEAKVRSCSVSDRALLTRSISPPLTTWSQILEQIVICGRLVHTKLV